MPESRSTTPQATAAIFARFLGIPLPGNAEFPVPTTAEATPIPTALTLAADLRDLGLRLPDRPELTLPHLDPVALPRYPAGVPLARCGYAVANITYGDGTTGTLIYLKAAVIEAMDLELLGYKGKTPDFPNESTLDQFYSEEKFEVHRAVGFSLAQQMLSAIETHQPGHPNLGAL